MENERLLWELEQMRGMADVNEVTRLRSEIDGLRQEMLHMANRYESLEVISCCCCSNETHGFPVHTHVFLRLPCAMWLFDADKAASCQLEVYI